MMWLQKYQNKQQSFVFFAQLLCLLVAGVLEFFIMTEGHMYNKDLYHLLHLGCRFSCFGFCLVTIFQPGRPLFQRQVLPAVAMALWFLVIEFMHRSSQMENHAIGMFLAVYLLAFPFAFVTRDQFKQTGLRIISLLYMAAAAVLLVFGAMLVFDLAPEFLRPHLYWDGTRMHVIHHPNISARIFMIAIALGLGFFSQVKGRWSKGALLLLLVLLFAAMAITNSRACILMTCLLMAGNLFFPIHNGTFKRFLLGAAAAVLAMVLLYNASSSLFQWHSARLKEQAAQAAAQTQQTEAAAPELKAQELLPPEAVPLAQATPEEKKNPADDFFTSNQDSLLSDLATFNSRTLIWTEAFRMIRNDPQILLWGTDNTQIAGDLVSADHPHNSWLEVLLRLGIPGFALSLVFTVQAIWSALCLLWHNGVDLWKKNIAMLLLCLLVTSAMEPFLFFTNEWAHFIDFLFFLSLGYLILWRKQLRN